MSQLCWGFGGCKSRVIRGHYFSARLGGLTRKQRVAGSVQRVAKTAEGMGWGNGTEVLLRSAEMEGLRVARRPTDRVVGFVPANSRRRSPPQSRKRDGGPGPAAARKRLRRGLYGTTEVVPLQRMPFGARSGAVSCSKSLVFPGCLAGVLRCARACGSVEARYARGFYSPA
jgi:hypothetical protein